MIFGGFKGFVPDRTWRFTLIVCIGITELFCFAGYLSGFADDSGGALIWHAYVWDAETVAYTAVLWFAGCAGIFLTIRSYTDSQMRMGTIAMFALPLLAHMCLALGWIELHV